MPHSQAMDAQLLYDSRSSQYDSSWHPRFARHIVELTKPQPGEKLLDLACGTGLVTLPAAEAVGSDGVVVGIDISSGMLSEARRKPSMRNVEFHQHSITDLDSLEALRGREGTFDLITCASALVLLSHPDEAVKGWVKWLKPGGRLIVDVTHPQSQITRITFERLGKRMGFAVPHYRLKFLKPDDLRDVLESADLSKVELKAISQTTIEGTEKLEDYITSFDDPRAEKVWSIDDVDAVFDTLLDGRWAQAYNDAETKDQARQIFKEEWTKLADRDGKVKEFDCVYVGFGRKS